MSHPYGTTESLVTKVILVGFLFMSAASWAQLGVPWRYTPSVVVVSATRDDLRIALVDEGVLFWNHTLANAASGFRIGPVTHLTQSPPEEALQTLSKLVLGGRVPVDRIPNALSELPGDIRVILGHSDFVSVAGPFDINGRRTVGIKGIRFPPLDRPNVARNVIVHELGHAIGLIHNSDFTALMCGRPADCRPDLFYSLVPRIFPLLESDILQLQRLYPANWKPQAR